MNNLTIGVVQDIPSKIWAMKFNDSVLLRSASLRRVFICQSNYWEQLQGVDLLIWRYSHGSATGLYLAKTLIPILESHGIKCFPNSKMTAFYDDKIAQSYLMRFLNVKTPKTHVFYSKDEAIEYSKDCAFPVVAKLSGGASSENVKLLNNINEFNIFLWGKFPQHWNKLVARFRGKFVSGFRKPVPPSYIYVQDYLPTLSDLRVVVWQDGYISIFGRQNRKNDFRASGSGNWFGLDIKDLNGVFLSPIKTAIDFSKKNNFIIMAYDFISSANEWYMIEMSYGFIDDPRYTNEFLYRYVDEKIIKADAFGITDLHLESIFHYYSIR